jgi:UDP-GlcNAc:undecaprenyl-phosphate GlcNAc-1-phosphate transferase
VVDELLGIFWMVGITNAINLLDNMDGLAGGISLISCVFLASTFVMNGQGPEAMVVLMLAGAVLGFLLFNFHPASIFMGDCGSMFLGFMLGGVVLLNDYGRSGNLVAVLTTPVLILLIPIFDTCLVSVTRKLSGRPASQGGKDHSSHRLVALGMTEPRAVLTLYGLAALSGSLTLMARLFGVEVMVLVIVGFAISVMFLGVYLGMVRVYEDVEPLAPHTIIRALSNFSYKRRVFEILLDVVLIVLTFYAAYLLRFDGTLGRVQLQVFVKTVPLVIVIEIAFLLLGGVYSGLWKYLSIDGAIQIAKGVIPGGAAAAVLIFSVYGINGPPRTVFVLQTILLLLAIGGTRLSFRVIRALILRARKPAADGQPVVIYGAGDAGEMLLREIVNNPTYRYVPVGFIDDDARKTGRVLHGFRIFTRQQLPELMERHGINEVLVSSNKVPESALDDLRDMGIVLRRLSIRIE